MTRTIGILIALALATSAGAVSTFDTNELVFEWEGFTYIGSGTLSYTVTLRRPDLSDSTEVVADFPHGGEYLPHGLPVTVYPDGLSVVSVYGVTTTGLVRVCRDTALVEPEPVEELIAHDCGLRLPIEEPDAIPGFGRNATGGDDGPVYTVTSLADGGTGSLRDAVSEAGRRIELAVSGTIVLGSSLLVPSNTSIYGNGCTIETSFTGAAIELESVHNIKLFDLRPVGAAGATGDNIRIWNGCYDVAVVNCTTLGAGDGGLDITNDCSDVTVWRSIIGETAKGALVSYGVQARISYVECYIVLCASRAPQFDGVAGVQFVNNVIAGWTSSGTRLRDDTRASFIANAWLWSDKPLRAIYLDPPDAERPFTGELYLPRTGPEANLLPDACTVVGNGPPIDAPAIDALPVAEAIESVRANVGARPRHPADAALVVLIVGG